MSNKRRLQKAEKQVLKKKQKSLPDTLTRVSYAELSAMPKPKNLIYVWQSKKYIVQVYEERNGIIRLSINRVTRSKGNWGDKITWDELQTIKRDVGYGNRQAFEIYPPDNEVVNVANMRHLWIPPLPLPLGFKYVTIPHPPRAQRGRVD